MENKNKTFRYKCARFTNSASELQQLLGEAVAALPKALDRREDIDNSNEHFRLLNETKIERGSLCGVIFSYHAGHNQAVTAIESDATSLDIASYAPPEIKVGARSEFVEGLLYFCCYKNHLVLVTSSPLQAKQFEDYLGWLLVDQASVKQSENPMMIVDPHKPNLTEGINEVKSITFKSTLRGEVVTDQAQSLEERTEKKMSFKPQGKEWDSISAMLKGLGVSLPDVRVDEGIYPEDIEVSLQIKCTKRRDRIKGATPFLDPIANAFRHYDILPFELGLRDGSVVKGEDFKVSQVHSVPCNEGIPDTTAILKRMRSWLEGVIQGESVLSDAS